MCFDYPFAAYRLRTRLASSARTREPCSSQIMAVDSPTVRCIASAPMKSAEKQKRRDDHQKRMQPADKRNKRWPCSRSRGEMLSIIAWWIPETSPTPAKPAKPPARNSARITFAPDRHSDGQARLRIVTDGAQLEAEARAKDQYIDENGGDKRNEDAGMKPGSGPQDRQCRGWIDIAALWNQTDRPWTVDHVARTENRDIVHHQGDENLIGAEPHLEETRNRPPQAGSDEARENNGWKKNGRWKPEIVDAHADGRQRTDKELPFRTDVPESTSKGQRHGKAR